MSWITNKQIFFYNIFCKIIKIEIRNDQLNSAGSGYFWGGSPEHPPIATLVRNQPKIIRLESAAGLSSFCDQHRASNPGWIKSFGQTNEFQTFHLLGKEKTGAWNQRRRHRPRPRYLRTKSGFFFSQRGKYKHKDIPTRVTHTYFIMSTAKFERTWRKKVFAQRYNIKSGSREKYLFVFAANGSPAVWARCGKQFENARRNQCIREFFAASE